MRGVTIFTLGHSTHALEAFLEMLRGHGIGHVVDVRRFAGSRRHPHFGREPLAAALGAAGIGYTWLPALGGRRSRREGSPHTAWRVPAFAAYADHMASAEFEEGTAQVLDLARKRVVALMCAEARVEQCHRRLIADWLLVRGLVVRHIASRTRAVEHTLTPFARLEGDQLIYDGGQPGLPTGES
jgi:uncharacterized protein (DUF488 family)